MKTAVVYEQAAQIPVTDLLPLLEAEFTDAPQVMLTFMLLDVVADFCKRTNALRRRADICTLPCVPNYLLEAPDETEVIAVMRIDQVHSKYCVPVYQRTVLPDAPHALPCCPHSISVDGNEVIINPPAGNTVFRVEMSVRPRANACEVDAALREHSRTLLEGVRRDLYRQTGKPWSNVNRATEAHTLYLQGCDNASLETMLHKQRGAFRGARRKF